MKHEQDPHEPTIDEKFSMAYTKVTQALEALKADPVEALIRIRPVLDESYEREHEGVESMTASVLPSDPENPLYIVDGITFRKRYDRAVNCKHLDTATNYFPGQETVEIKGLMEAYRYRAETFLTMQSQDPEGDRYNLLKELSEVAILNLSLLAGNLNRFKNIKDTLEDLEAESEDLMDVVTYLRSKLSIDLDKLLAGIETDPILTTFDDLNREQYFIRNVYEAAAAAEVVEVFFQIYKSGLTASEYVARNGLDPRVEDFKDLHFAELRYVPDRDITAVADLTKVPSPNPN